MEQGKLYRIGEVAKMFRLSVGSLRHYETMGILPPAYVDPESGYRYYSTRQFECLNTIRYLRMLDFSLDQIADFLQNRDTDKMAEMLQTQREIARQRRKEWQRIEKKIERRLTRLPDLNPVHSLRRGYHQLLVSCLAYSGRHQQHTRQNSFSHASTVL